MRKDLNAGFGETLTHELPALRDLGVEGIRSDCQKRDAETTAVRAKEIVDAGLVPLIVVAGLAQLDLLPAGTNVELLNEPDLEGPKASEYAKQVEMFAAACEAKSLQGWAGAVSNLIQQKGRGLTYLDDARIREWSHTLNVSIHWYPHKDSPHDPHQGFKSREHEVEALRQRIGSRRWGVSEFGYRTHLPTAAASIAWEWPFWERMGAEFASLFQLNDGTHAGEDKGIRGLDGKWKPAAFTFKGAT